MVRTLEIGDLFFCYRPRVDADRVRGLADVARFYLVLKPQGRAVFRRIVVGRKRLPDVGGHERTWGFVDLVASRPEDVEDELEPETYETRTRGVRAVPPVRPAGEAVYAIAEHDGHTHLAHVLELPRTPGPVQEELGIRREASLIVTVRNPEADAPPQAGLPSGRRARYPAELQRRFGDRRFAPLDPPEFLDHTGTELVLVGASADPLAELGIELEPEPETPESADLFTELRMQRDLHPLGPLLTGAWE
ncbi:MAG TPA: hypothetical protein VGD71_04755 [Kribbella sp.]|jgi:hypothetical protein